MENKIMKNDTHIDISSKNGRQNILRSRANKNQENLNIARVAWEEILALPDSIEILRDKNKKVTKEALLKSNELSTNSKITELNEVCRNIALAFNIIYKNPTHYLLSFDEEINISDIKKLIKLYLNADPALQIQFVTDSSKQNVDEKVQILTLNKYVKNITKEFRKPTKEDKDHLYQGEFHTIDEVRKLEGKQNLPVRSIDAIGKILVNNKNYKVCNFIKFAEVTGGHQSQQVRETEAWIAEADKYINKNTNDVIFIAQTDGTFAESHISDLKKLVDNVDKNFIGSTSDIISFLNGL
tara:strand:- start:169 stop:1059 length:891 start_codon:yes stop_codon:yes gene_type:complete